MANQEALIFYFTLAFFSLNYITILFTIIDIINYYKTSNLFSTVINIIILVIIFSISKYGFLRVLFGNIEVIRYLEVEYLYFLFLLLCQ